MPPAAEVLGEPMRSKRIPLESDLSTAMEIDLGRDPSDASVLPGHDRFHEGFSARVF
jgi:hypothetical protein